MGRCTPGRPRVYADIRHRPGRPSVYVGHLDDLPHGRRVVLVARVSTHTQEHAGNLMIQLESVREAVKQQGGIEVDHYAKAISGFDPDWLTPAIHLAQDDDAVIVAETVDRLMRPASYHSVKNPFAELSVMNLRLLAEAADGVPLYTVEHPDSTPGENRAAQTHRGQAAKSKGGRPVSGRSTFREKWRSVAAALRDAGMSYYDIATEVKTLSGRRVTGETVRNWLYQESET